MMVTCDAFEFRFEVSPHWAFDFIEEGGDDSLEEAVSQFRRVWFIDDEGKNYKMTDFIVDSKWRVVDLFDGSLLGFVVGGDFGMVLFDFGSDCLQLFVVVRLVGLAEE